MSSLDPPNPSDVNMTRQRFGHSSASYKHPACISKTNSAENQKPKINELNRIVESIKARQMEY